MPYPLKTKFVPPADTHTVIVLTDHYWGRGATKEEAAEICKSQGGRPTVTGYLALYFGAGIKADPAPFVDGMGRTCWTYADDVDLDTLAPKDRPQPVTEDRSPKG